MEQVDVHGDMTTLIHFVYNERDGGTDWRIACMPAMTEFHSTPYHPNYQRTDSVQAVTCPGCKRTEIFQQRGGKTPMLSKEKVRDGESGR